MVKTLLLFFFSAGLLSWVFTFGARALASRFNAYARVDARRRHDRKVPLLGGISFYALIVLFIGFAFSFDDLFENSRLLNTKFLFSFLLATTLIFVVGVLDDLRELKARPKFFIEIIAASLVLYAAPNNLTLFGEDLFSPTLVFASLVFWIVLMTNAVNFIDGMDGLCAGITGICSLTMALILFSFGENATFSSLLMAVLAGGCVGFLFHNFNPAKIFLGDSGSLLLGFTMAALSVTLDIKRSMLVALSVPLFMFSIPLFDLAFAVVRRAANRRSLFQGDRGHIHHRFQQMGISQRSTVIFLWILTAYLNGVAYFLMQVPVKEAGYIYATVLPGLALIACAFYVLQNRLSRQITKYAHLFLKEEWRLFSDPEIIARFVANRKDSYFVVVIDTKCFLRDLTRVKSAQVVEFYMNLYANIKYALRSTDFLCRTQNDEIAVVLDGRTLDLNVSAVVDRIKQEVRKIEESYGIFLHDSVEPEGVTLLKFPDDIEMIYRILGVTNNTPQQKRREQPAA